MCLVASLLLTINGLRFGCGYATAGKQLASRERRTGEKNVVSRAGNVWEGREAKNSSSRFPKRKTKSPVTFKVSAGGI